METVAAPARIAGPLFEPTQEVRFAVVLYGGVSLAIYINGIVQELLHLVHATAPEKPSADIEPGTGVRADVADPTGTEAVYRKLGQMLAVDQVHPLPEHGSTEPIRTRFIVDILSGTSAGGLNAVFLGKALANEQNLDDLKSLWTGAADIATLLNDTASLAGLDGLTLTVPVRSLLNASRLYWKLLEALTRMDGVGTSPPKDSKYVDELDCWITATDVRGLHLPIKLYDESVDEKKHRSVFRFLYRSSHASGEKNDVHSDFRLEDNPFLAFAARCTSSFPFAFDPMQLQDIKQVVENPRFGQLYGELGPDADWTRFYLDYVRADAVPENAALPFPDRSFGDGGYLDNKPFTWATDNISRRRADYPVDRRLIFLEPAPDRPNGHDPVDRPDALENAQEALLTLPRYETVREDIERLLERNQQVARLRDVSTVVDLIVVDPDKALRQLDPTAWGERRLADFGDQKGLVSERGFQWAAYHRLQVAGVLDDLAELVTRLLRFDATSDVYLAVRAVVQAWFGQVYETESDPRGRTQTSFLRDFDLAYRLRRLTFVDDRIEWLLRRGNDGLVQALYVFGERRDFSGTDWDDFRETLRGLKPPLNDVFVRLRRAGRDVRSVKRDSDLGRPIFEALGRLGFEGPQQLVAAVFGTRRSWVEAVGQARTLVSGGDRRERLTELADLVAKALKGPIDAARSEVQEVLTTGTGSSPGSRLAGAVVDHYYSQYESYDAVILPISYGASGESGRVEVIRFSPEDAKRLIDEDSDPSGRRKLGGATIHHFGGFLKQSWRVNDMMWGRLDAAERLIDTLLPTSVPSEVRDGLIRDAHLAIVCEERADVFPDQKKLSDEQLLEYIRDRYAVALDLDENAMVKVAGRSLRISGGVLDGLSVKGHRVSKLGSIVPPLLKPVLVFLRLSLREWIRGALLLGIVGAAALIALGDVYDTPPAARVGWALLPYVGLLAVVASKANSFVRGFLRVPTASAAGGGGSRRRLGLRLTGRPRRIALVVLVVLAAALLLFVPIALLNDATRDALSFLPGWG